MLRATCATPIRPSLSSLRRFSNLSKPPTRFVSARQTPWVFSSGAIAQFSDAAGNQPKRGSWRKWLLGGVAIIGFGIAGSVSMAMAIKYDLGRYPKLAKLMDSISGRKSPVKPVESEDSSAVSFSASDVHFKLLQYHTCPFSSKVRAYLDYYEVPYEIVEVNPVTRSELPSDFRKVPIVMANDYRLTESSVIVSIIESYRLSKRQVSFEELESHFPNHEGERYGRKTIIYDDKFLLPGLSEKERSSAFREEEKKWRAWVDDTFVHVLPPNIYRTAGEAKQAFDYISSVGNFGYFEAIAAQVVGASVMYMLASRLKERYKLKEDVRESLYDCGNDWMDAVGDRRFLGGDKPNLADLAVFGTLTSIEGFDAFEDLMENTPIKPWWDRMVVEVRGKKKKSSEKRQTE